MIKQSLQETKVIKAVSCWYKNSQQSHLFSFCKKKKTRVQFLTTLNYVFGFLEEIIFFFFTFLSARPHDDLLRWICNRICAAASSRFKLQVSPNKLEEIIVIMKILLLKLKAPNCIALLNWWIIGYDAVPIYLHDCRNN